MDTKILREEIQRYLDNPDNVKRLLDASDDKSLLNNLLKMIPKVSEGVTTIDRDIEAFTKTLPDLKRLRAIIVEQAKTIKLLKEG